MRRHFEEALLRSQIEVQETTYSILAKELHDNVGQLLSSSKMLLGIAQRKLERPPETLAIAEDTLAKAIVELRSLSKSLDKEWLEQFDLIENLQAETDRINGSGILKISFKHGEKLPFNPEKQIILFRIIQEALQNIVKHAQAKNIIINVEIKNEILHTRIIDDGKGMDAEPGNGLGIRNMKHRAKLLGGSIIWNKPEHGSCIVIDLPFKEIES